MEGKPTWKGKIYAKRNHDKVVEDPIPPLTQESDMSESQLTLMLPQSLRNDILISMFPHPLKR